MKKKVNDVVGDTRLVMHKAYKKWNEMHCRARRTEGAYAQVTVCDEWYTYSKFKEWITSQPGWEDMSLDKDLLVPGNTVYSPTTCCLIPVWLNTFLVDGQRKHLPGATRRSRGAPNLPWHSIGWVKVDGKWTSKYVGIFATEQEAHEAWKKSKHTRACDIAESIQDERIKQALRTRYL